MNDYIVGVDQHPVGSREPFDPYVPPKLLFDPVGKLNCHRCDLPRRATGRDHHVIRDVRFAGKRDGYDLLGLVVVERLKDETMEVFDVGGSAVGRADGLSGTFGQVVSWRRMAGRDAEPNSDAGAIEHANWGLARE